MASSFSDIFIHLWLHPLIYGRWLKRALVSGEQNCGTASQLRWNRHQPLSALKTPWYRLFFVCLMSYLFIYSPNCVFIYLLYLCIYSLLNLSLRSKCKTEDPLKNSYGWRDTLPKHFLIIIIVFVNSNNFSSADVFVQWYYWLLLFHTWMFSPAPWYIHPLISSSLVIFVHWCFRSVIFLSL